MKSIKHCLLGLVLATCAVFNAHATPTFSGMYFVVPDFDQYVSQAWFFGVTEPDAMAGDTFEYDFLFNTPPENADFHFIVHNAAGAVSVQLGISVTEALIRLRAYAFANDRMLRDVAEDVVARRLRF